jgi:hypothetical protein
VEYICVRVALVLWFEAKFRPKSAGGGSCIYIKGMFSMQGPMFERTEICSV